MQFARLTGKRRNARSNFQLGLILAMIAGAINAGGFFLIMQYTSHMTGIISLAADSAAIGEYRMAGALLAYIVCFIIGAASTAVITLTAKRYHLHSRFALPLVFEALILIVFSVLWYILKPQGDAVSFFIAALCFVMGLQNALITKVSSAIIRTTHITGMTTDLGIEIGRLLMGKSNPDTGATKNNITRHSAIILAFFIGGLLGALGVNAMGVLTFIAIALILLTLCCPQLLRDYSVRSNILKRKKRALP